MKRLCPICGSAGPRRVLHRQRFFDGPLTDGYDVAICRICGAGFADGIPSQAELDRYYADQSKYEYAQHDGAESPYDVARFERIASQISPFLPAGAAAILDVGCATGGLLACFQRRGYHHLLGTDPSSRCAVAARRLHGIAVETATISALARWRRRFDLILLVGVLEHLGEADIALGVLARLLSPGGLLYCAQPDVAAFAKCRNAPYQQFSVEHLNFFSGHSLGRLMARCELRPKRIWHWMVEWREGVTDSVVSGLYERAPVAESLNPPARERQTEAALRRYLGVCRTQDQAIIRRIARLVRSQEAILVWGAGTLTRRLLATTGLSRANIIAFVDSSPKLQGKRPAGRPIVAPAWIVGSTATIVISSQAFEREIVAAIRGELRAGNRIISLARAGGDRGQFG